MTLLDRMRGAVRAALARWRRVRGSGGDRYASIAEDYARYRLEYPAALFERLAGFGIGRSGQRVLDLGTGTAILARAFARRGCVVTGVDPSAAMLDQSRALDRAAGTSIVYRQATAERTGLPDRSFDVVAASMSWFFFDRPRAIAEARRVLVPHGALVLCHLHRVAAPGSVTEATNRLIESYGLTVPNQQGHGVRSDLAWDMDLARMERIATFSFDVTMPYSRDAWVGRVLSVPTVGPALSPIRKRDFVAALRDLLTRDFADEPLRVVHRVFAAIDSAVPESPRDVPAHLRPISGRIATACISARISARQAGDSLTCASACAVLERQRACHRPPFRIGLSCSR